jgi:hypothetical protein
LRGALLERLTSWIFVSLSVGFGEIDDPGGIGFHGKGLHWPSSQALRYWISIIGEVG